MCTFSIVCTYKPKPGQFSHDYDDDDDGGGLLSLFGADAATRGCHVRALVKGYHMVTPPFFLPYPNHSLFRWLNEALRCIPKFQCVLTGLGDKVFQKRGLKREEAGIRRYGCLQNMLVLGAYN